MTTHRITPRQRQILALHCAGRTYKEIAVITGLAPQTIKLTLSQAYTVMSAENGFEACTRYGMAVARDRMSDGDRALRPEAV